MLATLRTKKNVFRIILTVILIIGNVGAYFEQKVILIMSCSI